MYLYVFFFFLNICFIYSDSGIFAPLSIYMIAYVFISHLSDFITLSTMVALWRGWRYRSFDIHLFASPSDQPWYFTEEESCLAIFILFVTNR